MCRALKIPRGLVYYKRKERKYNTLLENKVIQIFKDSKNNYGTRKIKEILRKENIIVSRAMIGTIMKKYALVSNYTLKQFKVHKSKVNNDKIDNIVKRKFNDRDVLDVVVSDLTYVNVNGKWNYICLLLDLANREIIGFAAGKNKDTNLVYKAFLNTNCNLEKINIFHTDRGNEFKNKIIDEVLETFKIKRSLSKKGCPYDNAVAESTYKIVKTEFAYNKIFSTFEELEMELFNYVNWYNNFRIHGSLNYMTPIEYKSKKSE